MSHLPQNRHKLTIRVWCLTECKEVYYRIVHLQHSGTFPVHYRQTRPPAHRVVGQTTRQDYKGLPGTYTHIGIKILLANFYCNHKKVLVVDWSIQDIFTVVTEQSIGEYSPDTLCHDTKRSGVFFITLF